MAEHLLEGIRAILFDAVGTLIHPRPPASLVYAQIGRKHGSRLESSVIDTRFRMAFQVEESQDRMAGWKTSEAREYQRWRNIVGRVLDDAEDAEGCFNCLFHHFARPNSWHCQPSIESALHRLAEQGYILGLASNYDSRLRSVVQGRPELGPIRHLVISSEVGWRKPAPEFFQAALQLLRIPASEVLFVGDDPVNDVQGAIGAGMLAVQLVPGDSVPHEGIIRDLCDLVYPK